MKHTEKYTRYALCREMMETVSVVRNLDTAPMEAIQVSSDRVLLSGEGSSRIFPAKHLIARALRLPGTPRMITEACLQAREYDLEGYHVFIGSNSGRTAEGVKLIRHLRKQGTGVTITGVVAHDGTPIALESDSRVVLQCGAEAAVAATKSVVEQALVYDEIFRDVLGEPGLDREKLASVMEEALAVEIDPALVARIAESPLIYFAGRNDGVAEELTLKTNEITRKRADYLEGTYAVHGIEEVMNPEDTVVLIDPYPEEEEKFAQVLSQGVGLQVVAIASRETRFPTIRIPQAGPEAVYAQLAAGWNLLVEIGLALGVNPDKPQRARKVGNEFQGS